MSKLALKRLTASDLTFFAWQFGALDVGNQKAINLNADVFVRELFPGLRDFARDRLPIDLYLYGPGLKPELNLQRKVVKGSSYKNWRLNGELVVNPPADTTRFDLLREGDLMVIEFNDGPLPSLARCVFLAAASEVDAPLIAELESLVRSKSMVSLAEGALELAISTSRTPSDHPIQVLLLAPDLEDAVQGGIEGTQHLRARREGRRILRDELLDAKQRAEENGFRGEELVNAWLQRSLDSGQILEYTWTAAENAVAPYDFLVVERDSRAVHIDVKSTSGGFERPMHISLAELYAMAETEDYSLYRVYGLTSDGAELRIASGLRQFAQELVAILERLPRGVTADSVSVPPNSLSFSASIRLTLPD